MKIIYGLLITLALVVFSSNVVLADDTGWLPSWTPPPPTETSEPTTTDAPTETPVIPTDTPQPTPTSPPEWTPTPIGEPTPTTPVDPTSTPETKKGKPSPTPDCANDYENNKDKCLAPTGIGSDMIGALLLCTVAGLCLFGLIIVVRNKRDEPYRR